MNQPASPIKTLAAQHARSLINSGVHIEDAVCLAEAIARFQVQGIPFNGLQKEVARSWVEQLRSLDVVGSWEN